jgi:hypothetical protein
VVLRDGEIVSDSPIEDRTIAAAAAAAAGGAA